VGSNNKLLLIVQNNQIPKKSKVLLAQTLLAKIPEERERSYQLFKKALNILGYSSMLNTS